MKVAKFRVIREILEQREEFLKTLPEGTEIISETKEDLHTVFVIKHDDLPEVAIDEDVAIPEINPIIYRILINTDKATYDAPEYRYEWDWNVS